MLTTQNFCSKMCTFFVFVKNIFDRGLIICLKMLNSIFGKKSSIWQFNFLNGNC